MIRSLQKFTCHPNMIWQSVKTLLINYSSLSKFLTSMILLEIIVICICQSGALAGIICDVTLFPLDTLKTRLQSQHGFFQSGGFRQLYKGIGPVVLGSAPSGII